VLFATEGRDGATVERFAADLAGHGGDAAQVASVCCDMSPALISGIAQRLPAAEVTFDRYHVIQALNSAVDEVRRGERRHRPELAGSKYVWLKRPRAAQRTPDRDAGVADPSVVAAGHRTRVPLAVGLRRLLRPAARAGHRVPGMTLLKLGRAAPEPRRLSVYILKRADTETRWSARQSGLAARGNFRLESREGSRGFVRQADPGDGDPPRVPVHPGDDVVMMTALSHVGHHTTPDVGRTDDLLFGTRIVPVRREPGRVFARTLRRDEPDDGTRVHVRPGDQVEFEVGSVVAELDAIDDLEDAVAGVRRAPVAEARA